MSPPVPVLLAVPGAAWEGGLVAALERPGGGVRVVRRCMDLADLLASAATGTARAALLSADLRRLDRDVLARLAGSGVVPIGLVPSGDEVAVARLRGLGMRHVLPVDPAETIAAAVAAAVHRASVSGPVPVSGYADPAAALPDQVDPPSGDDHEGSGGGRLVAVWGPTGAPGRTTVAVTLAAETARAGVPVLLADADVYGGSVAQVLGLLDEAPGLAGAARLANSGTLDLPALSGLAPLVAARLSVLPGIIRPDRWPELRPAALEQVWSLARELAPLTVVDCGFNLERDEEISFDVAAPRRNGATLATLERADAVVAVGAADPVGLQRLVRGLADLRDVVPGVKVHLVINKVRRGAVGDEPERQLLAAAHRHLAGADVEDVVLVPYDRDGLDRALLLGRTLPEAVPGSPVRSALAPLAARLLGRDRLGSRRRARRSRRT